VFVGIEIVAQVGLFIVPTDAEVGRVEDFAQLVSYQIDDGLAVALVREDRKSAG
jgi:hypothetical protein